MQNLPKVFEIALEITSQSASGLKLSLAKRVASSWKQIDETPSEIPNKFIWDKLI